MWKNPLLAFAFCVLAAVNAAGEAHAQAAPTPHDALIADAKKAMMTDPKAALGKAKAALTIAQAWPASAHRSEAVATSFWLESEALTRLDKVKDARAALDQAIRIAANDGKTTKLDGDIALSLARIADNNGNIALALKSFQKAHDIFAKLGVARSQSIALQGLGGIYDEAHAFDREIGYYRRASQVYSEDPALELSASNNVGYAQLQLGHYDEAAKNFQRALDLSKKLDSPFLTGQILNTLAAVYAKQHKFADAMKAAHDALHAFGKDDGGQAPFVYGVEAEVEYERGNLDAAAADLDKAFHGVDLAMTIAPYRDMHEIAYKVYRAKGNLPLAMAHLEAFKRLDDQGRSLAASANLALMGAQFDFTNQKLEIAQLKSAQLERDISLRESRAAMQRVIFITLFLAGFAFAAWIGWRHMVLRRHRDVISKANTDLTRTLGERDSEIERRTAVEAELRLAKRQAEQANISKSHFLANMSHELRTPLNAIIGFSEMLTNEVFGAIGNARYKEYANDINTGGRSLLAVLNDILDMARIDAGNEVLADDNLSLHEVVDSVVDEFQGSNLTGKSVCREAGDDVWVHGDAKRLRQVVVNLVSNAVKFTGADGDIRIRVARAEDGGADIFVSDNGVGIPEDKLAMVLEPFGQAESAYARSHGGIGLGLPIVRSLVEMHGGRFSLMSELDAGTTAKVHLPPERMMKPAHRVLAS
ncbi:MAG TPA: ATP-binding protein [Rhizomicrobium sp.]|jgi:signal transduction histidine kinase